MVEQLRRALTFGVTHGLKDSGLGHTVQIAVHGRLPTCFDHVEIDGLGQNGRLRRATSKATGGDARAIGVHLFLKRIVPETEAMRQQGQPAALVEGCEAIPEDSIVAKR